MNVLTSRNSPIATGTADECLWAFVSLVYIYRPDQVLTLLIKSSGLPQKSEGTSSKFHKRVWGERAVVAQIRRFFDFDDHKPVEVPPNIRFGLRVHRPLAARAPPTRHPVTRRMGSQHLDTEYMRVCAWGCTSLVRSICNAFILSIPQTENDYASSPQINDLICGLILMKCDK